VIYPPVSVRAIQNRAAWASKLTEHDQAILAGLPTEFILGASRFVRYKRLEDVIRIGEVARTPVVIAGSGPDSQYLHQCARLSNVDVRFVDEPSDALLYALYERAMVFVFTAVEDFGIMPVEAMASGTPVIVNAIGGALEPVERVAGGAILRGETSLDMRSALKEAARVDTESMRKGVRAFDTSAFDGNISRWQGAAIA